MLERRTKSSCDVECTRLQGTENYLNMRLFKGHSHRPT